MWIDANAFIGHWPFRYKRYSTPEALLDRMDHFGVDRAIVSHLDGIFYKNVHPANRKLVSLVSSQAQYEKRFIPFGVINPLYSGWEDDFEDCISTWKMKGIRIYPLYHKYSFDHPQCQKLLDKCASQNTVVAICTRIVDRRPSSWMDINQELNFADIALAIQVNNNVKYLITNVANRRSLDDEPVDLFKSSKILMDTSGRVMNALPEMLREFGPGRFAFGSHSPILDYCTGMLRIEALMDHEASDETKERLRSRNLIEFLEIQE